jgi:hypothetical protein
MLALSEAEIVDMPQWWRGRVGEDGQFLREGRYNRHDRSSVEGK